MKVMLGAPMLSPASPALMGDRKTSKISSGILYLGSMLRAQPKLKLGEVPGVQVLLEDPNQGVRRFADEVKKQAPDIYGCTCYEFNLKETREIFRLVKMMSPKTLLFAGGPAATFAPGFVARATGADAVFRGESDFVFRSVVRQLSNGASLASIDEDGVLPVVKGVARKGGKSHKIPSLRQADYRLITPDIGLFAEAVSKLGYTDLGFTFSRGCPQPTCSFCQITSGVGNKTLETGAIISILKEIISQIPLAKYLAFGDALPGNGKQGAIRLMNAMKREGIGFPDGMHAEWSVDMLLCNGEFGKRKADVEMINLMQSLCMSGEIGVESLSEGQLRQFNKYRYTFGEIQSVLGALKSAGFPHIANIFLWGGKSTPYEAIETIERAFELAYSSCGTNLSINASPMPYLGTAEYAGFMKALKAGDPGAISAKAIMGAIGGGKQTGDANYPFTMGFTYPLDRLMQIAVLLRMDIEAKLFARGPVRPLYYFMSEDGEVHLLAMLIAIKRAAEMRRYAGSEQVEARASLALEKICADPAVAALALHIKESA